MTKLKKHTLEYYDYHEMVERVEQLHGVDVRDFARKYGGEVVQEEVEYQDLWHWLLDNDLSGFERGALTHINWKMAHDSAVEQCGPESWQVRALKLFFDEYGDEDYTVIIDW